MKTTLYLFLFSVIINSCSKKDAIISIVNPQVTVPATPEFTHYRILQGNHYCDGSTLRALKLSQQSFRVKFDSTAVYKTLTEDNQFDINKLFGFSEGLDPHKNSARIGWSYNNDSLRLYGYVYNNSLLFTQEITTCKVGQVVDCSIKVDKKNYVFVIGGKSISFERAIDTDFVEGFQLYPYFGGDETAPHTINIFIAESGSK